MRYIPLALGVLAVVPFAAAAGPLVFESDLPILARPEPVGADFTGDGVQELMGWWSPFPVQQLIDGRSGAVVRSFRYASDSVAPGLALLPDVTGDGRPEFLFAGGGAWVAQRSDSVGGGIMPNSGTLWTLSDSANPVGIGERIAVTGGSAPAVLAAAGSSGRLFVVNPANGAVMARIGRDPATLDASSFATMAHDAGDLNGDGVHDFAVGAPGRYPQGSIGRIYFLDGRTRTAGDAFVPVTDLPSESILAVADSRTHADLGIDISHSLALLGDPDPADGVAQSLMLVGSPYTDYYAGGAVALLLTRQPGGANSVETVAEWVNDTPLVRGFAADVQSLGDINGDGVSDAAVLETGDGSHIRRGRILIISGRGLLDGFSAADVLQEVSDPRLTFSSSMRFLGDYDGDGYGELAVSASGPESAIRIYSVVPEPSTMVAVLGTAAFVLVRRRPR